MKTRLSQLLIITALINTSCQPSAGAVATARAQTQAVEAAFNGAVAAAETQSAQLAAGPTKPVQAASTEPAATYSPEQLAFTNYLDTAVQNFHPDDGAFNDARVVFLEYQVYDNGNATVMDVGMQKSDQTKEAVAEAAILQAFKSLYSDSSRQQGLGIPANLQVFRVHIYDSSQQERFMLSGQWTDVIAYGQGSLSSGDLLERVTIQQAVP